MITLITGAPGAGKTAALVSMLEELGKDRPIFSHGIPDLKIPHVALDDPHTWPDSVPDGAVVIIDEVQTAWRPSGPGQKIPESIQRLETHRHRGLDFFIITQGPNLVHSNVRSLVGRHVHLRDIGVFGRWWYEWPETADNCRTGWKTAPVKKKYKLPKHVFSKYKSASLHTKSERSIPRSLYLVLGALVLASVLGFNAYKSIHAKMYPAPPQPLAEKTPGPIPSPLRSPVQQGGGFDPHTNTIPAQPMPQGVIDDRVAFVPRVPDKPETAPAYDHLRQVVNMPTIAGAMCTKTRCKCVTASGTDVGISEDACRAWLKNPPFDPYTPRPAPTPSAPAYASAPPAVGTGSQPGQNAPAPYDSAASIPAPVGPAINPAAEARQDRTPPGLPPGLPGSTQTRAAPQNLPIRLETIQAPLT